MKNFLLALSIFILFFTASAEAAQLYLESNGFYFSDGLKVGQTSTDSRMLLDFSAGFTLDKSLRWQLGWNYAMHSASTSGPGEETYSSAEMGPKVTFYFDKERTWATSLTYNLIVTGSYKSGAQPSQNLRGTGFRFDVGYGVPLTDRLRLGARLVYNMTNFNEEVDDTTLNKISYSRTFIYPAFHISYLF